MKDIIFIEDTEHSTIISKLENHGVKGAHFTNGIYAYKAKMVVPTTLAGFKWVSEEQKDLPFIIAINSDVSVKILGKQDLETQTLRAKKVAEPLAKAFPNNQVIIIYYDEKTPTALYEQLSKSGLTTTLHKWGYGTADNTPKIEGAEYFEQVYAFPLPNDKKPVCYYDTEISDKSQNIIIFDLRDKLITENGVLFKLPASLQEYIDPTANLTTAASDFSKPVDFALEQIDLGGSRGTSIASAAKNYAVAIEGDNEQKESHHSPR